MKHKPSPGDALRIGLLKSAGYVVLREQSYHRAQERQRIAEVRARCAEEDAARTREWAHECGDRERRAWSRGAGLYALAAHLGASEEQLRTAWFGEKTQVTTKEGK